MILLLIVLLCVMLIQKLLLVPDIDLYFIQDLPILTHSRRFLVADDIFVDRFVVRDADSRPNAREWAAVQEWIESGYSAHIMRDHPAHDVVMNAGVSNL